MRNGCRIVIANFDDIPADIRSAAKADKMPFLDNPRAVFYVAFVGESAAGAAALLPIGKRKVRFWRCYVLPEWRKRGIGSSLYARRLEDAIEKYETADVFTRNPPFFEIQGWRIVKQMRVYAYMKRELR